MQINYLNNLFVLNCKLPSLTLANAKKGQKPPCHARFGRF